MLRKLRIAFASVAFVLITLLFLDFTGTLHAWLGWLAKIQFLPAVLALNVAVVAALVVLTLVCGRIYCSVVCPLGVMQDVVSWLNSRRKKKKYRFSHSPAKSWLRYTVLALFVAALIGGLTSAAALLAPYSSYGRMAQNLLQPLYALGNNALAAVAAHYDSYAFYSREVWVRSVPTLAVAAVSFVLIAVLAWRGGRTYCNTICPVGTVLGFISRFAWLKISIDDTKCNRCGLCAKRCKAACIDSKSHTVDYSRCVACGDCIETCHKKAISYVHPTKATRHGEAAAKEQESAAKEQESAAKAQESAAKPTTGAPDNGRRMFLIGTALAATSTVVGQEKKKVDGGLAAIKDKVAPERATPLTPPGSVSAQNMAQHCTACQLCVSQCPNDVLRPSTELGKFMQPTMSYERGYCRPECTACSDVCPTGAIKPITVEEKTSIQVGHAVWVKKNCVPLTDGRECGNCARHCPAGAIMMVSSNSDDPEAPKIPAINAAMCIGCGTCEYLCPARPYSAIYVEGHEVHREI